MIALMIMIFGSNIILACSLIALFFHCLARLFLLAISLVPAMNQAGLLSVISVNPEQKIWLDRVNEDVMLWSHCCK